MMHIGNGADPSPIAIESTTTDFGDSFSDLRLLISNTGDLSREVNQCKVLPQPSYIHYGSHLGGKIVSATRQSHVHITHQCYWFYFTALRPGLSASNSPKN